ncbi:MAG: hypothetical protein H0W86_07775 [Armatimonadetes bacterium]|nr:hypothetical protein [Armatimonadota bacterium]
MIQFLSPILCLAAFATCSSAAHVGGGGPLALDQWHGKVEVKPIEKNSFFRAKFGAPPIALKSGWQPVLKGEYVGAILIRTAKRAWLHLGNDTTCLDGGSLVRIDSGSDIGVLLRRGRLSKADGRRGPSIAKPGQRLYW